MAQLTRGDKMALYLLLSSPSKLKAQVNGTLTAAGAVPSAGDPPVGPAGSPTEGIKRLVALASAPSVGVPKANFNDPVAQLNKLFNADGTINDSMSSLLRGLAMDGYPEQGTCPGGGSNGNDTSSIVSALKTKLG